MLTVTDGEVASALLLLERAKMVVEPSGVIGLAALMAGRVEPQGRTVALLCGGNIDALALADLMQREMLREDRYLQILTSVDDRPGGLSVVVGLVAQERGNIITVLHNRLNPHLPLGVTEVEMLIEVRDRPHQERIITALRSEGYTTQRMDELKG